MRTKQSKVPCRDLSKEENQRVLVGFEGKHAIRNRALWVLLVRTGFRISEALSLYVHDVLQHGQIVDIVTVTKNHMKGARESRSIPLHSEAKEYLLKYLNTRENFGKLFDIGRYQAWCVIDEAYIRAKVAAPHGTHAARKTFATRMYKTLGNDIFALCKLMGHRNVATTQKYLSVSEERLKAAVLSKDWD